MKKRILIIYHSQSGNTEKLAEACFNGVIKELDSVEVRIKTALGTTLHDIENSDGLIILTPEYFGTMCGAMKDLFDRTYYPAREKQVNLPFALVICYENEGFGTERDIMKIATGYTLRKSLDTLIVKDKELPSKLEVVENFGHTFATGISMSIF